MWSCPVLTSYEPYDLLGEARDSSLLCTVVSIFQKSFILGVVYNVLTINLTCPIPHWPWRIQKIK